MAANTTPDGIVYPTSGDQVSPLETVFANMANSVQTAINKRQGYYYRWADNAARLAQTGMRSGDKGFQVDTGYEFRYNGTKWELWSAYGSMTYTGPIVDSPARASRITREGKICTLTVNIRFTSSPAFDTTLFTIPDGWRPVVETFGAFPTYSGSGFDRFTTLNILPNGNVAFKGINVGGSVTGFDVLGNMSFVPDVQSFS
jgi:hypothetical protein